MGPSPASALSRDEALGVIAPLRDDIEQHLARLLDAADDPVSQAMHDSTLGSGKRVRPLLLVLATQELGGHVASAMDLACAVEMVHSASLILDDLPCMDNAQTRRGQPTVHRRFGEDIAMLGAIALLTRAFAVIAQAPGIDGHLRTLMVARLANAVGMQGLVKGQYRDLHENPKHPSPRELRTSNRLKTGVLFEATLDIAALLSGADDRTRAALSEFAEELGQAFQLCDDLLDDLPVQGKDTGQDRGKTTLVSLLGKDAGRRQLNAHLERADAHLADAFGPDSLISSFMHQLFEPALRSSST